MIGDLLRVIRSRIDGREIVQAARDYRRFPIRLGFTSYNEGIAWIGRQYESCGLETETVKAPADGEALFGDHHFPLAWDVEEAWIRLAEVDGADAILADYEDDPYGVVPFCGDSGGVRNGVIVPAEELREQGLPRGAENVAVLFDRYTYYPDVKWALDLGCAACLVHPSVPAERATAYGARRWFNDLFGEGHIDRRHRTLPAFSISPKQGAELAERYRRQGPVPVTYLVRSQTYAGELHMATARLTGREHPDSGVWVTAHAYEPHASNNVSGVAISIAAARAISELVRSGELPPPRRTIRFFHGLEHFGPMQYAALRPGAFRKVICGMTVDCLGSADASGATESLRGYRCFDFNPSFLNGLFAEIATQSARRLNCELQICDGYSSNDNVMQDPLYGPAWVMLNGSVAATAGRYHTNADTPETLSSERMAEYAAMTAAALYFAANAGPQEAKHLARLACDEASRRFARTAERAVSFLGQDAAQAREQFLKFQAFADVAVPAGIESIRASAGLLAESERVAFLAGVSPISRSFSQFTRQMVSAVKALYAFATGLDTRRVGKFPRDRLYRSAANTLVRRKLPGALGLGTVSPEARREAADIIGGSFAETFREHEEFWHYFAPRLFWLDGKRSVLDAALAHWSVTSWDRPNTPSAREDTIRRFMKVVEFLERHGLVEVERIPVPHVTQEDVERGLTEIGLVPGDVVMVHSSLSQFGHVEGGADAVIDALLEVIGSEGIVAMPTFTNTATGEADPPFDPATSPVYTGTISETFRQREGVLRNSQPTHSVAAWGERAAEFLASKEIYDTFDRQGPWGKLLDWDGKIVFFGETIGANTYLHALEAWYLNYLDLAFARVTEGNGEREVFIRNYPDGCRGRWYGLQRQAEYFKRLKPFNLYRETRIGAAAALVVEVRPFTRAVHGLLKEEPDLLLHKSGCLRCAERRAKLVDWRVPDLEA